jgi:hypothetical protein
MNRKIGVKDFLDKKFITYEFGDEFKESFGEPEKNFTMLVYGHPGNGKTEFCIKLAKYLCKFTKVYYNSYEQGISKTLQDALKRNHMNEVSGKITFGDKEPFDEMIKTLGKKNAPQVVFIDSRDYMNLTGEQYRTLIKAHPRKSFIIICWESGGKPKGEHAKAIEYMVDIKVQVKDFKAFPRCRFGGNKPFVIWNKAQTKTGQQQLELQ